MEDVSGLFITSALAVGLTTGMLSAACMDRGVDVEQFERAVSKCSENGGLKLYEFDSADATVTCNNGAVFYYKLGEKQ